MKFVIHVAIYEGVPINVSTEANTVKIYFVIYLEKLGNKVIPKYVWDNKVVCTS